MYTTNAIEAVNSGFRKVTKRVVELQKKWADRPVANRSLVRNQLLLNDRLAALFDKFDPNFHCLQNLLVTTENFHADNAQKILFTQSTASRQQCPAFASSP